MTSKVEEERESEPKAKDNQSGENMTIRTERKWQSKWRGNDRQSRRKVPITMEGE
jgi:hypothetical protein